MNVKEKEDMVSMLTGTRETHVHFLALPQVSCEALGKLLNLSVSLPEGINSIILRLGLL